MGWSGKGKEDKLICIKALLQSEGNVHLSDISNWNVNKALIKTIRVVTLSTDWDLYLLQNDNGFVANDANIPMRKLNEGGESGDTTIYVDFLYKDEDLSKEVHLYLVDNSGVNTFGIYVSGTGLV